MADELDDNERRALDAWATLTPPPGFAERVLDARQPVRSRRTLIVGGVVACAAVAAALLFVALPHRAASGTVTATERQSTRLGDRGVAVAESGAELVWRIDGSGTADIDQRAGNVFYRVEHGEPFVVHTPAGDVRVTGTCFRVEIEPMNSTRKMLLSGAAGAALASAVIVTVYEGHVLAETKTSKVDVAAGARARLDNGGAALLGSALASASRDELVARTVAQQSEISTLREQLAKLEGGDKSHDSDDPADKADFNPWKHHPTDEQLLRWAERCQVRYDHPEVNHFQPVKGGDSIDNATIQASEADPYNTAMSELQKGWQQLVRSLYVETTNDAVGADSLSTSAMENEIEAKSPPGEAAAIRQKIARERAGLQSPPSDLSKTSPLERYLRAKYALGDQAEAALAKRLGPDRAREIRGDGWGHRGDSGGCPESSK
jgi:hypothetical protein